MESIVFDTITLKEVPVTIAGISYTLREPTEEAATKYRDALSRGTKIEDEGKSFSLDGIAGADAVLVSACLYDGNGSLVPIQTVRGWPRRIVKKLFETAEKMGGLGGKDKEEVKNSPSATTTSS